MKFLGEYSWEALYKNIDPAEFLATKPLPEPNIFSENEEKTVAQTAQEFHLALSSMKQVNFNYNPNDISHVKNGTSCFILFQIFTTEVFRGIFGLATWWSCFTMFATTAMGMLYQTYFAKF